jgi:hypothetical protein
MADFKNPRERAVGEAGVKRSSSSSRIMMEAIGFGRDLFLEGIWGRIANQSRRR